MQIGLKSDLNQGEKSNWTCSKFQSSYSIEDGEQRAALVFFGQICLGIWTKINRVSPREFTALFSCPCSFMMWLSRPPHEMSLRDRYVFYSCLSSAGRQFALRVLDLVSTNILRHLVYNVQSFENCTINFVKRVALCVICAFWK